jgi:protein-disulfide isomerase
MTSRDQRKRRLAIFGAALLTAIAAVAIVIAVASGGSKSSETKAGIPLAGIPQSGNTLGAQDAKGTLMVFADLQCPFCGQFETQAFPSIVNRYVKTGKLRVVFQPISILGDDSVVAAKAAAAAAQQDKLFDYASAFYANQGQENTGYVTGDFLTKIAKAVPGLNVAKWKSDMAAGAGGSILTRAEAASRTARVASTPTFFVAKTGGTLERFNVTALTPEAFRAKLHAVTS